MSAATAPIPQSALNQLRLFFALSRTPHGVLDIATPAVAALLWYGAFPPLRIILLGLITAFAGYTAVYALNDLVDYRVDKKKLERGGFRDTKNYLDAVLIRHPVACGLLTFKEALLWITGWALLALIGAYLEPRLRGYILDCLPSRNDLLPPVENQPPQGAYQRGC